MKANAAQIINALIGLVSPMRKGKAEGWAAQAEIDLQRDCRDGDAKQHQHQRVKLRHRDAGEEERTAPDGAKQQQLPPVGKRHRSARR